MLLKNSEVIPISLVGAHEKMLEMQARSSVQQKLNWSSFGSEVFMYSSAAPKTISLLLTRHTQSVRNLFRSGTISFKEIVILRKRNRAVSHRWWYQIHSTHPCTKFFFVWNVQSCLVLLISLNVAFKSVIPRRNFDFRRCNRSTTNRQKEIWSSCRFAIRAISWAILSRCIAPTLVGNLQ